MYASPVLFVSNYSYCLRHRRNTRYGGVASPYPAGTYTQQDTPSLSWRCNGRAKRRAAEMLAKHDDASRRVRLSA